MTECFRIFMASILYVMWLLFTFMLVCTIIGICVVIDEGWYYFGNSYMEIIKGDKH